MKKPCNWAGSLVASRWCSLKAPGKGPVPDYVNGGLFTNWFESFLPLGPSALHQAPAPLHKTCQLYLHQATDTPFNLFPLKKNLLFICAV